MSHHSCFFVELGQLCLTRVVTVLVSETRFKENKRVISSISNNCTNTTRLKCQKEKEMRGVRVRCFSTDLSGKVAVVTGSTSGIGLG